MIRRIFLVLAFLLALSMTHSTPAHAIDPNTVYVVGDSYSFDMQSGKYGRTLSQAFAQKGWTAVVSGVGGRGIGGSPTPNGLQQVTKDCSVIGRSQKVVVELGTNTAPDGNYWPTRMTTMIGTIRKCNPSAPIFWVTPANFVTSASYQGAVKRNRDAILVRPGITPIRWDLIVQKGYFNSKDAFKHPRVLPGYQELEDIIVETTLS